MASSMTTPPVPPRLLHDAFKRAYPDLTPDVVVRAPGRVNLLGGHVDMHGGTVINIAINRDVWLAASYGSADLVQLYAADLEKSTTFSLRQVDEKTDAVGEPLANWSRYPAGVAWAFQHQGLNVPGIYAAYIGQVPMRAGLSSSAAVEEAFAIAWQSLANWRLSTGDLARLGNAVERDYLGLGSGIQDQFTCLHAEQNHVIWLDCRSLDYRHTAVPYSAKVVICDTATRRELVGSGYSGRAQDAHAAARTISLLDPTIKSLRDVTPDRLPEFEVVLPESQFKRARHVVTEIDRVARGFAALQAGDPAAFGALMNASYWSARDDYGSSSPALDAMWQAATRHAGCFGARYSGGGEAGAVVALVEADAVEDFITATTQRYEQATDCTGVLYAVEPAQGAGVFG